MDANRSSSARIDSMFTQTQKKRSEPLGLLEVVVEEEWWRPSYCLHVASLPVRAPVGFVGSQSTPQSTQVPIRYSLWSFVIYTSYEVAV
jgi:hypothetical protein